MRFRPGNSFFSFLLPSLTLTRRYTARIQITAFGSKKKAGGKKAELSPELSPFFSFFSSDYGLIIPFHDLEQLARIFFDRAFRFFDDRVS